MYYLLVVLSLEKLKTKVSHYLFKYYKVKILNFILGILTLNFQINNSKIL